MGLLGPNGSGKTTTIRLLLGLLRPTSGRATVAGFDCWRNSLDVRRLVSYLPGELRMYGALSGLGTLKLLVRPRDGAGLDRAVAIAERVMKLNLRRKVRTYSTGMKQKLALAQVFSDPVDTLILDEPTSALDPRRGRSCWGWCRRPARRDRRVIFSGHVLAEVEQVADRVAIMRKGRLMHVEDMHARRRLRMLLDPIRGGYRAGDSRGAGAVGPRAQRRDPAPGAPRRSPSLLRWLASSPVDDIAIGTEDLRSLYDRFHGPNVPDEEAPRMRPFWALIRKQFVESRWTLVLSAAALFGLGWLFVYVTSLTEAEILRMLESDTDEGGGRIQFMRMMGVQANSVSIMMTFWNHPLIMLLISIWAIGRGSAAVAAEIERGTMDLILSRPVARWSYLASQVLVAIVGLAILAAALFAGASIATSLQLPARAADSVDLDVARPQSRRPGFADLRLHTAGVVARPRALAAHVDRVGLDAGRHHRLRRLDDSGLSRFELEALAGAGLDLQSL